MQQMVTLMEALEAKEVAEQQAQMNAQRLERADHMLRDLLACAKQYVDDARKQVARVPGQQWDQAEAIAETVAPLEARIADIERLL